MITFSFDDETNIRTTRYSGTITNEELIGAYRELLGRPDYEPTAFDLVDLREVTEMNITGEGLLQLFSLFAPIDAGGYRTRTAFVAATDTTFELANMYATVRGAHAPETIHVFREYEDAVLWLQSA